MFAFLAFIFIWAAVYRLYFLPDAADRVAHVADRALPARLDGTRRYYRCSCSTAAPTTQTSGSPRTCACSSSSRCASVWACSRRWSRWSRSSPSCGCFRARSSSRDLDSRLHGVGRAALRDRRHLAHPHDRPAAHRPGVRPAAFRGRFPLLARAPAREQPKALRSTVARRRSSAISAPVLPRVIANWWNVMRKQKQLGFVHHRPTISWR